MSSRHRSNYRYNKYYQYPDKLLASGFTERSTWKGLKKAWRGFRIAKVKGEHDKALQYALIIHKFQKELKLPLSNFTDLITEVKN